MSKQAIYGFLALIVLVIIGGVVYIQSQNQTQEASQTDTAITENTETTLDNTTESSLPTDSTTEPTSDQGRFSDEGDLMSPDVAVVEIAFSGTAYSPATVTIKNGDIVVFKNNSDKDFWPASASHPDHLIYPEFDAKQGIAPGKTYQFKFTKVGEWGFHDHLTPSAFGKITVE